MFLVLLVGPLLVRADERSQRLAARLSEEADAFARVAPQLLGEETLNQTSLKPPPRFRPRVGDAARLPPQPTIQRREIRSEYSFAKFSSAGDAIHELRQVIAVDGKPVQDAKKAQEALARAIAASDDSRKRQMLKDFEKHGLNGAATDFGQMILMFGPRNIGSFEFNFLRAETKAGRGVLVFSYSQIDGPEQFTIVDGRNGRASDVKMTGEVWVVEESFQPIAITLSAMRPGSVPPIKEEAVVEYNLSEHGVLVPFRTFHKESVNGKSTAENEFHYSAFKRFGASSDLKFEVDPDVK
jgi:hypothetical protein